MFSIFRQRNASEIVLLIALGAVFLATNHWVTFFDDEVTIISAAAAPVHQTLQSYWSGEGLHEHPPLHDLLLHFWLKLSGARFALQRVPGIACFLLGLWMLSRAGEELGGPRSAWAVLWLGALWPYGYHYGRVAAWYPFCFMVAAGLTLAYLRLVKRQSFWRWSLVLFLATALVYTNYFGWAMLACLGIDFFLRERANWQRTAGIVAASGVVLIIVYLPLWRAFFHELSTGTGFHHSLTATGLLGGFEFYNVFVSESVAPWFLALGIPACLCIGVCTVLTLKRAPAPARRLLIYFLLLMAVMTAIGIIGAKRLLPVAAWLLLPIGVTLGTLPRGRSRTILSASLAGIVLIGWYGIISREHYSAPRFIEPWQQVASEAAESGSNGALILGNHPSFFFYLAYTFRPPGSPPGMDALRDFHPEGVFDVQEWMDRGQPVRPEIFFVRGAPGPLQEGPAWDAEQWLDRRCQLLSARQLFSDPASPLKSRFLPEVGELLWRIRIRQYSCAGASEGISTRNAGNP